MLSIHFFFYIISNVLIWFAVPLLILLCSNDKLLHTSNLSRNAVSLGRTCQLIILIRITNVGLLLHQLIRSMVTIQGVHRPIQAIPG